MKRTSSAVTTTLAVALIAIVLSGASLAIALSPRASVTATKRTVYMSAIEPKGSTTVDKEPFPPASLPAGGGYILKPPDATGKWEVSSYGWEPAVIVVYQGDEVTLQILGINGKEHVSYIEGYVESFNVKRGELTVLKFTADKVGTFRIVCKTHSPSMEGYLVVLPRA